MNEILINVNGISKKFLVDTGASLCAVKYECIARNVPFTKHRISISGVGGKLISEGYINLKFDINDTTFEEKIYIFKNLTCNSDGILGKNFFEKYNAILNFENNTISLKNNNVRTIVPLLTNGEQIINIPPRCEVIKYIETSMKEECVIKAQELCEGVFMAGIVVRPNQGKIPIKILNTRESRVILKSCVPEIHSMNDYEVCEFSEEPISVSRVKQLFSLLKLKDMTLEEQVSIENICAKYADIFHMPNDKLGVCNIFKQSIKLKENATPVYVKPYRLPQASKDEINKQIDDMLRNDIIEEAQSEFSSPLLIVPKKTDNSGEKKWRVVIDYRLLNQKIQDDKFPLPNITEILDSLSGAMYFSHLDLSQGYYQLELDRDSRPLTAFLTNQGQFQMKRLPMGLKISPSSFSRLMTIAMSGLNYEKCFVYLDDLIIFGRNLHDHNSNLMKVFDRLRQVNLKLNPSKCEFLKKDLLYLGNVITPNGILPDEQKTQVLKDYPTPKTADEVKRFVAFANYYRRYIPHFAELANPLNKLTRKGETFTWSDDCQNSFNLLKNSLSHPPLLQYPDFSTENEFILQTDASGLAIGAVLSNKDDRPVAYASRSLNKSELNYATIEKELLAIVWAVKYFRPYLFGRHFKIKTDHRPLLYLFNHNNPSSRLTKFRLCLEEYDFHIEFVKGRDNVAADALSRIIIQSSELKGMKEHQISVMTRAQSRKIENDKQRSRESLECDSSLRPDQPNVVEILKRPNECVELNVQQTDLTNILRQNDHVTTRLNTLIYVPSLSTIFLNPDTCSTLARAALLKDLELLCKNENLPEVVLIKNNDNKALINDIANIVGKRTSWTGPRICIIRGAQHITNRETKKIILNDFHLLPTSGHAGIRRMTNNIKRRYYWPGMHKDIENYVKQCDSCQRYKHQKHIKEPMVITTTATSAFQKIYLDTVGPIEKDDSDNCYILTLQCELTKFVEAYPIKSKDATTIARTFVDNFILRYGIPLEIATDRGTEFIASTMSEICKLLQINQIQSTAYHHQSIGALENSHKVLGAFLRTLTNTQNSSWSSWIPYWCFSYNNTVHCETNYSPYELVFGKQCNIPNNLCSNVEPLYNLYDYPKELKYRLQTAQSDAYNNLVQSKLKRKVTYDKTANSVNYKKDDLVLVKKETGNKLSEIYEGPYTVIEECSPNVKILRNRKEITVHKNRTKPYYEHLN